MITMFSYINNIAQNYLLSCLSWKILFPVALVSFFVISILKLICITPLAVSDLKTHMPKFPGSTTLKEKEEEEGKVSSPIMSLVFRS